MIKENFVLFEICSANKWLSLGFMFNDLKNFKRALVDLFVIRAGEEITFCLKRDHSFHHNKLGEYTGV